MELALPYLVVSPRITVSIAGRGHVCRLA